MKGELPVGALCEMLGVSRSGYYRWKEGRPTQRQRDDAHVAAQIAAAHARSRKNYGAPRIVQELRAEGTSISKRRCARLMKSRGLQGRKKHRRRPRTTDSGHVHAPAKNLLAQQPAPTGPNQAWMTDIMPGPGLCRVVVVDQSDAGVVDAA
jgi:putative transposase